MFLYCEEGAGRGDRVLIFGSICRGKSRGDTTWTGDLKCKEVKLDFAERDKSKAVLLRLSLARNLEKPLMSLYGTVLSVAMDSGWQNFQRLEPKFRKNLSPIWCIKTGFFLEEIRYSYRDQREMQYQNQFWMKSRWQKL
jgi:hypothetical protein